MFLELLELLASTMSFRPFTETTYTYNELAYCLVLSE